MRIELREHYVSVVSFLGKVLGPNYEIALHDLSMGDETIIAIANGHVTNRQLSAPLTGAALGFISKKRYEKADYEVNYTSLTVEQKALRSSTLYIKDAGKLVGLLCITFDDSQYKDISHRIMSLCHPDELLYHHSFERLEDLAVNTETEIFGRDIKEVFQVTMDAILEDNPLPMDRLKKKEKLRLVYELKKRGIFLLKGAVPEVAKALHSSEATIYRYLNEVEEEEV